MLEYQQRIIQEVSTITLSRRQIQLVEVLKAKKSNEELNKTKRGKMNNRHFNLKNFMNDDHEMFLRSVEQIK